MKSGFPNINTKRKLKYVTINFCSAFFIAIVIVLQTTKIAIYSDIIGLFRLKMR